MRPTTLEALYREHHEALLRRLRGRGAMFAEHAEDALADVWTTAARLPEDRINPATARAYLYVCARNRVFELAGKTTAAPVPVDDVELAAADDVHALVVNRERVRELLDFVTTEDTRAPRDVPAGDQLATVARRRAVAARMVGVSYKELAASSGTTYTHVNRATAEGAKLARRSTRYA